MVLERKEGSGRCSPHQGGKEREEECGCENGKMEKVRVGREGKRERGNRGRRIVRKKEMRDER